MIGTAKIVGMTAQAKADLFKKVAKRMIRGRYVAAIALASLEKSRGYRFESRDVEDLAAKNDLDSRDVSLMLWVGRKLIEIPELDEAFRSERIGWTKVRTLVPHITRDNAPEWIPKAIEMSSGCLGRAISTHRRPSASGPMLPLNLSLPAYQRVQHLARCLRAETGEKFLSDEECLMRILDEFEAQREAANTVRTSRASGMTSGPVPAATTPAAPAVLPVFLPAEEVVVPVDEGAPRSRHIPIDIRRKVMIRARWACEVKSCRNRHGLDVHHVQAFHAGGPHSLANLAVLCHRCHENLHREEPRAARSPVDACEPRPAIARPPEPRKTEPGKTESESTEPDGGAGASVAPPSERSEPGPTLTADEQSGPDPRSLRA